MAEPLFAPFGELSPTLVKAHDALTKARLALALAARLSERPEEAQRYLEVATIHADEGAKLLHALRS